MMDINLVIADNIWELLKSKKRSKAELAERIGVSEQTMSVMLRGGSMFSAIQLQKIAIFFNVPVDSLTRIPMDFKDGIQSLMMKAHSPQAKKAIRVADKMSDMILFHSKVRRNGAQTMKPWDEKIEMEAGA